MSYQNFVLEYTGRDMDYHKVNGTTGIEFGRACWDKSRLEADAEIERLKAGLDRLHRERDSFQEQCRVMAEENAKLEIALREFAKANSWQNFGDCRSFGDG